MDTLTSIKAFRNVVECGSFAAAAEHMDISNAMVSKHVAHAEKRLGVRLLNRNSHTLSLTEPGRVYFERCKTILNDLEATELELGFLSTAPRGTVRITCPSWFARQQLAEEFAEFRRRFPDIVLDIALEDREIDLVEEDYDLALRVTRGTSLPPGLIARPVRAIPGFIAASREYLKRNGAPKCPEELAHHDFVAFGNADTLQFNGSKGTIQVQPRVVLRYRSILGVAQAIAAGIGLASLPEMFLEEPAFKEVLTPVLTDYPLEERTLYIVYVSRRYLPPKVRALIDFLMERLRRSPGLDVASVHSSPLASGTRGRQAPNLSSHSATPLRPGITSSQPAEFGA
jgi:DNA-binding transcriptional LysR family regulator